MVKILCPKCEAKKVYLLSNKKRKCSQCKYEFTPYRFPLYFTRNQWRDIIRWFLLELSSQNISFRTGFERRRVLRALTIIRSSLTKDVPDIFSGTAEVDETYLGGQWKNKRRSVRDQGSKRGRGTTKQPVFVNPLSQWYGLGRGCWWRWSWHTSTSHLKKSFSRFYYLFWYLESIHRFRFAGLCSPSRQSQWKTIQRWKRKSYQWSGGILGIFENEKWYQKVVTREITLYLGGTCRDTIAEMIMLKWDISSNYLNTRFSR